MLNMQSREDRQSFVIMARTRRFDRFVLLDLPIGNFARMILRVLRNGIENFGRRLCD